MGCMQINDHAQKNRLKGHDPWDAVDNVSVGLAIYRADGFRMWCGSERAGIVARGKDACHGRK